MVRVPGRFRRRLSIAALACYKPGHRSRPIYRPRADHGNPDGRKSFAWRAYGDLLQAAHQELGGPIMLIWDNLNVYLTAGMRRYIANRHWLIAYQLPSYAPDLNPVEGIWSLPRHGPRANTAFANPDHVIRTVRGGLREIQYRNDLLDGCLAGTGLTIRRSP